MEFLLEATYIDEDNHEASRYFGPFMSQKRAEECLVKICQGFVSIEVLARSNGKDSEAINLSDRFLGLLPL